MPTDLQSLLQMDFSCLADEIERSCPQCFAATGIPRARTFRPSETLFIQVRRGGLHSVKKMVPVRLQSVWLLGKRWEVCTIVCNQGPQANDGHYIVMQAGPSLPNGWLLQDDAIVRAASDQEVARMATTCSALMLRPSTAAQVHDETPEPAGLTHPPLGSVPLLDAALSLSLSAAPNPRIRAF